jgi:hypothetical protein
MPKSVHQILYALARLAPDDRGDIIRRMNVRDLRKLQSLLKDTPENHPNSLVPIPWADARLKGSGPNHFGEYLENSFEVTPASRDLLARLYKPPATRLDAVRDAFSWLHRMGAKR